MFMPRLGTTHLRNSLPFRIIGGLVLVVAAGLVFSGLALTQTSPTPTPAPQSDQTPAHPDQSAPTQAPPGSPPPNQAPSDQPPAGAQATTPKAQPPAGQAPTGPSTGVVDDKNRLITNLDRSAFSVSENDQPQQIRSFRREDLPVAIGIVIDNSGSMREKRDQVNKAALNLVRSSNAQDQVFVVNFSDEYYLDQEFTSDIKKLQAALEKVEARGGTALYDAIVASADYVTKSPQQRKVLFVVTDGEDDASQLSLEQAMRALQQENGPVVYAIGLLGEEKARKAKRALQLIADRTGGARAKPYKRLTVRTRTGYYPGQEQQKAGGGQ